MPVNKDYAKWPKQAGKLAVVTGAESGLGFETSLALAGLGCQVIMACFNLEQAKKAHASILEQFPKSQVEIIPLDLGNMSQVRGFAAEFTRRYHRIDYLINNAGVMLPKDRFTEDGLESHIGVNYLGHFLLTGLLMPLLRQAEAARIVSISSLAHRKATLDFEYIKDKRPGKGMKSYGQSKLACLMFSYELQRRLDASDARAISVAAHPGISNTMLGKHLPLWFKLLAQAILPVVTHAPHLAARCILQACLDSDVAGGDYIGPGGFKEMKGPPTQVSSSAYSYQPEPANKLWELSEELVGLRYLS